MQPVRDHFINDAKAKDLVKRVKVRTSDYIPYFEFYGTDDKQMMGFLVLIKFLGFK